MNTTAYPRLLLSGNDDESSDVCATNIENISDPLQLQEYELDIPETDTNKRSMISTTPTTVKTDSIEPVQFIVCAPSNDLPLLLRRNKTNQANIIITKSTKAPSPQKPIVMKTFAKNAANESIISAQKRRLPKNIQNDDTNYILEPVSKKLQLNQTNERNKANQNGKFIYSKCSYHHLFFQIK